MRDGNLAMTSCSAALAAVSTAMATPDFTRREEQRVELGTREQPRETP
jgi:hypothetical protein